MIACHRGSAKSDKDPSGLDAALEDTAISQPITVSGAALASLLRHRIPR